MWCNMKQERCKCDWLNWHVITPMAIVSPELFVGGYAFESQSLLHWEFTEIIYRVKAWFIDIRKKDVFQDFIRMSVKPLRKLPNRALEHQYLFVCFYVVIMLLKLCFAGETCHTKRCYCGGFWCDWQYTCS